ncbi:anthranilate synthase component II [Bacillus sp. T33-2]|uniref:anthranilate synthase component II n=1 Tax=Bacillus sp. T33-2 TaxID=2054168 RepID=UPI000C76DFE7|nr:aminodeoxychorismate/anthranilate synthase component II [Bacillus sp. T33-2]PLR95967.1 aminodeoxychorismate/anthranilate synthase component II [Bacillus sp. T33-2]
MILVIDNYDSFTFNLVQYIKQFDKNVAVIRNDQTTIDEIKKMDPEFILISPGPGNPEQAGLSLDIVKEFYKTTPILGICLGHQVIAQFFGTKIIQAERPMHGKVSLITHDGQSVFNNMGSPLSVTRYHSLIVDSKTIPDCLEVSAVSPTGEIMAIRHKKYKVEGMQFHPESILTESGIQLLKNFFIPNPKATELQENTLC